MAFAQEQEPSEILYINSYNADSRWACEFAKDFQEEYSELGGKCNIAMEGMNCSSLQTKSRWMGTMRDILSRHPNPKMVLLYGPEAWACYLSLTEQKWRETPIGLIAADPHMVAMESDDVPVLHSSKWPENGVADITLAMQDFNVKMCYYYEYAPTEDLQAACRLMGGVKTVTIVGDNSFSGFNMFCHTREAVMNFDKEIGIVEINGLEDNTETASKKVRALPKNSVLIFGVWRYDSNGTVAVNTLEREMASRKDMAIFSLTGRGLGQWALGGCTPQYDWHDGRILPSKIAHEVVDLGKETARYMYKCPNYYTFDLKIIESLGLDTELLPNGAQLLNNKLSVSDIYAMYPTQFILSASLFVVLVIGLALALTYMLRINSMKRSLMLSENQLRKEKNKLEHNEKALVEAKNRAEASDKMKTRFIQDMSHEIRTPLNAIQGFSRIILDPTMNLDDASRANLLQHIVRNVTALTDIVDDILLYSDIDNDQFEFTNKKIGLHLLCVDLLGQVDTLRNPQVKLALDFKIPIDATVTSDEKLVRALLLQLLRNACKFTEKGVVSLECQKKDNGTIIFSVSDTGPGIPADKAEYIFERFKKLDEFSQGIGLGLTICRIIAKKLDGKVQLDTSYKSGARFTFEIGASDENS